MMIFKEGVKGSIISNKQQITDAVFELSVFFFTKVNNKTFKKSCMVFSNHYNF